MVFGSGFSLIDAANADFSVTSTIDAAEDKGTSVTVLRGIVAMEGGVKLTEAERNISTYDDTVMLLKVGKSRRLVPNRGKREVVRFENFAAVKTHIENQLSMFASQAGVWGKQSALKNAAKIALRLKKQDEVSAYYERCLRTGNTDWYAQSGVLRAFAAECAIADDPVCSLKRHTAALDLAEKLYPDE